MHRQSALLTTTLSALLAVAASCSSSGTSNGSGTVSSGACNEIVDHVRSLYVTAATAATDADAKTTAETLEEDLNANVHMVVSDCETAPKRFIGCIRVARTVAELESDCIIPLDDDGLVEGRKFQ